MPTRIDAVEKGITSLRNEMLAKFEAADAKTEYLRTEMTSKFDSLEAGIPAMEKMVDFEARGLLKLRRN